MKILFLTLGILVILSFVTSQTDTNSTSIPETYNLINLPIAKPGCNTSCGDLIVPYPFGIGLDSNCSIGIGFDIHCNTSFQPHKAFFRKDDITSWIKKNISDSTIRISNIVATRCYSTNGSSLFSIPISNDFSELPYTFSQVNRFTVLGCNDYAWLTAGVTTSNIVYTGCMAFCSDYISRNTKRDTCSGDGCCESPIPPDIKYYSTRLYWNADDDDFVNRTCTYAFMGEQGTFRFNHSMNLSDLSFVQRVEENVPVVLEWAIGNLSCAEAKTTQGYACQSSSICVDSYSGGYRCQCIPGYQGNPYLSPGCQDIDECTDPLNHSCYGVCKNTLGDHECKCKKGYSGDATILNGCKKKPFQQTTPFYIGIGLTIPTIVIGLLVLYLFAHRSNVAKLKAKYLEKNGGNLLKDAIKTKGGVGLNSVKVFNVEELKKATDNFSESNVLGMGGNGTVYKGTLEDKRLVAIKKSKRIDEEQREDFINEMVILTQINHNNVVNLLGFCLETDVPLLAYEFVSNNTLHHHIHNRKPGTWKLSWDDRLRIAHESAGALAYLHRDTRMPIIHRDVKSTNILLDENFTAKIADFGASRIIPLAQDGVGTLVKGTLGYLDPEYFHTGLLTETSDVYSFGVVLAELLTGEQPVGSKRSLDKQNLTAYFLREVKENNVFDLFEQDVVKDATNEQLKAISDLTCRCINQIGANRPSMKEVTMVLDTLRKMGKQTNPVSEHIYNETSSPSIETEPISFYSIDPLKPKSDTFTDNSISSETRDMMLSSQIAR